MKNIEIKYRIANAPRLTELLKTIPEVEFVYRHRQVDTYFRIERGRLKLRQEDERPAYLIRYFREDADTPRVSDYTLTEIREPQQILRTYTHQYGVLARVAKWRELFMYRNVRIHIDEVAQLGWFLEFEAVISSEFDETVSRQNLNRIMAQVQSFLSHPVAEGYLELSLMNMEN